MHIFHNPGKLDPLFITQFGLSVKESNDAIGQFGTGLKYAIAAIMRGGGHIEIETDGKRYIFDTREHEIRGRTVHIVTCNGADTSFNVTLGKNWKPWMAFRELYCNALDEGGGYLRDQDEKLSCKEDTRISVRWCAFDELDTRKYFRTGDDLGVPIAEVPTRLRMYDGARGHVYYKGVLVCEDKAFAFGYELLGNYWMGSLSEDRIIAPAAISLWLDDLKSVNDWVDLIKTMEARGGRELLYVSPPAEAMPAIRTAMQCGQIRSSRVAGLVESWQRRQPIDYRPPNQKEAAAIAYTIKVLRSASVEITAPIEIYDAPGHTTLAQTEHKTIRINSATFAQGPRQLIKAIIEEHLHIVTGAEDFTVRQQHAYLDLICQIINATTENFI